MNPTPAPLAWQADAACAEEAEDLWFPRRGQPTDAAKAVCRRCLVREECLGYAQANRISEGVWGGLTGPERRALTRNGPRSIPEAVADEGVTISRRGLAQAG